MARLVVDCPAMPSSCRRPVAFPPIPGMDCPVHLIAVHLRTVARSMCAQHLRTNTSHCRQLGTFEMIVDRRSNPPPRGRRPRSVHASTWLPVTGNSQQQQHHLPSPLRAIRVINTRQVNRLIPIALLPMSRNVSRSESVLPHIRRDSRRHWRETGGARHWRLLLPSQSCGSYRRLVKASLHARTDRLLGQGLA